MTKVLVTGASGYIGGKLTNSLLIQSHSVRALVRRTSNLDCLPPVTHGNLELVYGDVNDYQSLLHACVGCHVVFHVAAIVGAWLPDPSRFFSVNVGGLKNVLKACKETKTVEKIIYTSSCFALGCTDGGYVADEKQIHGEKLFFSEYEKSKAAADKVAMQAAADGMPIVIVYPGLVYGPGKVTAGNTVARVMIDRFNGRLPGYIGNGNDKFSFSHVEDVVNGHIAAMHKGRIGEGYLLTGENASFKRLFDVASIITGTTKPWFHIPLLVLEAYGWLSILFSRITGNLPPVSPPSVEIMRHQWAYSCDKAKAELGYEPRGLSEGLREVLSWLKSLGLIDYREMPECMLLGMESVETGDLHEDIPSIFLEVTQQQGRSQRETEAANSIDRRRAPIFLSCDFRLKVLQG